MGQIADTQANIASLKAQGVPDTAITGYGGRLNASETSSILNKYQQANGPGAQVQSGIAALGSQQYQFDPNKYLPAIQGQADSIYSPQSLQLQAIRELQQAQTHDTRIQTEKDFTKRMQQEVESINRRGSFFSGGAIQNEQDLRSDQSRALRSIDIQGAAADYSNLAQQAVLQAEKADYIQQRLTGAENSAYARWSDNRNFSMQALTTQYNVYAQERDFARSVFESDRSFEQSQDQMDMQKKQFKLQYKMDEQTFQQAKEAFNMDMKVKNLSYAQAMDKFKENYDTVDYLPGLSDYKMQSSEINIPAQNSVSGSASSFNIDSFILGQ